MVFGDGHLQMSASVNPFSEAEFFYCLNKYNDRLRKSILRDRQLLGASIDKITTTINWSFGRHIKFLLASGNKRTCLSYNLFLIVLRRRDLKWPAYVN